MPTLIRTQHDVWRRGTTPELYPLTQMANHTTLIRSTAQFEINQCPEQIWLFFARVPVFHRFSACCNILYPSRDKEAKAQKWNQSRERGSSFWDKEKGETAFRPGRKWNTTKIISDSAWALVMWHASNPLDFCLWTKGYWPSSQIKFTRRPVSTWLTGSFCVNSGCRHQLVTTKELLVS